MKHDSFEAIALDAVDLLMAIIADLNNSDNPGDQMASAVIALTTASFCERAIALAGE